MLQAVCLPTGPFAWLLEVFVICCTLQRVRRPGDMARHGLAGGQQVTHDKLTVSRGHSEWPLHWHMEPWEGLDGTLASEWLCFWVLAKKSMERASKCPPTTEPVGNPCSKPSWQVQALTHSSPLHGGGSRWKRGQCNQKCHFDSEGTWITHLDSPMHWLRGHILIQSVM